MRTNKLTRTLTGAALALAMTVGLAGTGGRGEQADQDRVPRLQADEDYDGSLVFKDYVESRTNGEIEVVIYFGGQFCGSFQECIDQIMSGVPRGDDLDHRRIRQHLSARAGAGSALRVP